MAWTDEEKQQAVEAYKAAEPTAANSSEILAGIAEDMGQSVNGVRMILIKAGVYVKVAAAAASPTKGAGGGRVSKAAAQEALVAALTDAGAEVDMEIISKLTGKAAQYFTSVLSKDNDPE